MGQIQQKQLTGPLCDSPPYSNLHSGRYYGGGAEARVLEGLVTQLVRILVWLQHDKNTETTHLDDAP